MKEQESHSFLACRNELKTLVNKLDKLSPDEKNAGAHLLKAIALIALQEIDKLGFNFVTLCQEDRKGLILFKTSPYQITELANSNTNLIDAEKKRAYDHGKAE